MHNSRTPVFFLLFLASFSFGVAQAPIITSTNRYWGAPTTTITISGSNFNPIPANNLVQFGSVSGVPFSGTANTLNINAPIYTRFDPISVLNTTNGLRGFAKHGFSFSGCCGGVSGFSINPQSFLGPTTFDTGQESRDLEVGDMDGDGVNDIVLSRFTLVGAGSVSVFRNQGLFTFAAPISLPSAGNLTKNLSLADLDGDGKIDIVAGIRGTPAVISVWRNTSVPGALSFAARQDFSIGSVSNSTEDIEIHDIDMDGKPEIIVTALPSKLVLFQNLSVPGTINLAPQVTIPTAGQYPYYCSAGDINEDGKTDIVVSSSVAQHLEIFLNNSIPGVINGTSLLSSLLVPLSGNPQEISLGDLDQDGDLDLAFALQNATNPGSLGVIMNTSISGALSLAAINTFPALNSPISIDIGDLNQNGSPDIAVGNFASGISIYANFSDSTNLVLIPQVQFTGGSENRAVEIADFQGTLSQDLLSIRANSSGRIIVWYSILACILDGDEVNITGHYVQKNNHLSWNLTNDIQNAVLSRSSDGVNFEPVHIIDHQNTFIDSLAPPISFYKIELVLANGQAAESDVFILKNKNLENELKVWPNPASTILNIEKKSREEIHFEVFNIQGKRMMEFDFSEMKSIPIHDLPPGKYILKGQGKESFRKTFVVID